MKDEVDLFRMNITDEGYIDEYPNVNISELYEIFQKLVNDVEWYDSELSVGYIHNDLNIWNIINWADGVEFIDFDGVNKNLILKEYIILIIRFNLFNELEKYFEQDNSWNFIIWWEIISYDLIKDLYKIYSIYLIMNMVYYIGYDQKDVVDTMYTWENQSWQEIYHNLKINNLIQFYTKEWKQ